MLSGWGRSDVLFVVILKSNYMKFSAVLVAACCAFGVAAQSFECVRTTEGEPWKAAGKVKLSSRASGALVESLAEPVNFGRWGTCFNERGYDALNLLPEADRAVIMKKVFAPDGELRINMGRIPMNANDYALDW